MKAVSHSERCAVAQSCFPESSFKARLTALHADMLAEIEALTAVALAAAASVRNPAWAGICDEDVALEEALLQWQARV